MSKSIHKTVSIRDVTFNLMTYTKSLELCSRMNYETENLDFIDQIPVGQVLYDLGACEGRFSVYALKKGLNVISFEPEKKNHTVLLENIALNDFEENTYKILNVGVGANTGEATMNIGQPWEGGHQKVVEHGNNRSDLNFDFVSSQSVEIVSLDEVIKNRELPKPNYLKIDIDGSEMPFLEGAKETLQSDDLKRIIFELNEEDIQYKTIIEILNSYSFIEVSRHMVPNEPSLYNIILEKRHIK